MMRDDHVLARYNGSVISRLELMVKEALDRSKSTVDVSPYQCRYCHRPFSFELQVTDVPFGYVQYHTGDVCEACRQASDYCPNLA